jgi:pimeloyl-ACP methyl ester carboxylesterase
VSETTHTVTTPDGRTLRVIEAGVDGGTPVVVHYGTPQGALPWSRAVADAVERGARLISYDRPGYGGSTSRPGRSVGDCAADVVAIADALGIERFVTWGVSGGGPHALACAALLGDRVAAAASLAGVAPFGADGLDWLAGMGELNLTEFGAAIEGAPALEAFLGAVSPDVRNATPEALADELSTLLSPVDADAMTGDLAEWMVANGDDALAPGVEGWRDDDLAFAADWGFDLDAIGVPVLIWHGRQDRFVPTAHGEWLAARIAGAEARITDDDGHLTLYERRVGDVHDWLLERL